MLPQALPRFPVYAVRPASCLRLVFIFVVVYVRPALTFRFCLLLGARGVLPVCTPVTHCCVWLGWGRTHVVLVRLKHPHQQQGSPAGDSGQAVWWWARHAHRRALPTTHPLPTRSLLPLPGGRAACVCFLF